MLIAHYLKHIASALLLVMLTTTTLPTVSALTLSEKEKVENTVTVTPTTDPTLKLFFINPSLPSPHEASPGQATSTYMDPTGRSIYNETVVDSTSQTFSWTPVVGASKYALYVRNLDTNVLEVIEENLTDIIYNTNVLKAGAHYKWNVRAKDSQGKGGWLSDGYYFKVREGVANAIDDGTAVKYILVDETNDPIASTTISVECLNLDGTKCAATNQLQLFVQNPVTDSYGNYLLARSIYPSYAKFKTSVTVDGITKENVSEFTTAIVKELIVQIPRQKVVDEATVLGLLGGAYDLVKGLGEFAYVLVIHTTDTVYALIDSVENYEKVGNAIYEGLKARKAEILYVDPDNYISIYNGSKALGRTTFDVCTIVCTLGGGAAVKGTQLAKVTVDVSKTANKVVEVNKLVEVIKTTNNARILAKFSEWLVQGLTNTVVYIGYDANGVAKYVGITTEFTKRAATHLRDRGIIIRKITDKEITWNQARTIEQNIINANKALESDDWLNLINSIAKERDIYQSAIDWGADYMRTNGIKFTGY